MSGTFSQACPVCGRQLLIQSSDANSQVVCAHCQGVFVARSTAHETCREDWRTSLMKRADELLDLAAARTRPRLANAPAC
jgi:hypothetical protein